MKIQSHGHEHEYEPQYGLPERLPAGERILWQGSPDFRAMARQVFHIRKVVFYFSFLLAAHVANLLWSGSNALHILMSLRWLLPLAVLGIGAVFMLAWMTAKTTVYTLTDKRVVMRVGIVLTVTFNLPLQALNSAGLLRHPDGYGDITLALGGDDRIAWLQLWPSVRPWRFTKPEPMLRSIPNAQVVSDQLSAAWLVAKGQAVQAKDLPDTSGNSQPHTAQWQAQTT
ncbi:MAG: PH domain-containing protein [Pseudorhodobacter sp.]|nr:PH domain-containing protein [Rhizobacter sp.]